MRVDGFEYCGVSSGWKSGLQHLEFVDGQRKDVIEEALFNVFLLPLEKDPMMEFPFNIFRFWVLAGFRPSLLNSSREPSEPLEACRKRGRGV